jgi:two-component system LytT family response regulator
MDIIRTIIVDDEKPARVRLMQCLRQESDVDLVGLAQDGGEAVQLIRSTSPALVFLDVQMPGLDGFGVFREIGAEAMPLTVFVTAHDRYAVKAFETHAVDYLLKPFSDERFESAMAQARRALSLKVSDRTSGVSDTQQTTHNPVLHSRHLERIAIRVDGRILFLNVADIDWIEAAGVYVHLHVGTKTYLHRSSIIHLVDRLDPAQFVRLHRSTIVNATRILELQPRSHGDYVVILDGGTKLTLSRAYKHLLEKWLRQEV